MAKWTSISVMIKQNGNTFYSYILFHYENHTGFFIEKWDSLKHAQQFCSHVDYF